MTDFFFFSNYSNSILFLELLFFLFSFLIVLNAILVILSENPIYSILYLILVFINSAMLLLLFYIDFLSIIILVVYVGAFAVLFLFVVMMMNVRIVLIQESMYRYLPIGFFVGGGFLIQIFLLLDFQFFNSVSYGIISSDAIDSSIYIKNWFSLLFYSDLIISLSECLFAYKWYYFLVCAVVLFLAMVGSIMLTLYKPSKNLIKSQLIPEQVFANYKSRINLFYIRDFK